MDAGILEQALDALGRAIGLEGLRFDEEGMLALPLAEGGRLVLERDEEAGTLRLGAEVGMLPGAGREAWVAGLLAANLFARDSGEGVFGLDGDDGIVLRRDLPLPPALDGTSLVAAVSALAGAALGWRRALAGKATADDHRPEDRVAG